MVKKIVITVRPEHYEVIARAADTVGSTVAAWARTVIIERARVVSDVGARAADKAEHDAGVAERRDNRQARKAAKQAEDLAWAEVDRCTRIKETATGAELDAADKAYRVADAALQIVLAKVKALT